MFRPFASAEEFNRCLEVHGIRSFGRSTFSSSSSCSSESASELDDEYYRNRPLSFFPARPDALPLPPHLNAPRKEAPVSIDSTIDANETTEGVKKKKQKKRKKKKKKKSESKEAEDDGESLASVLREISEFEATSPKWESVPSRLQGKFRPIKMPIQESLEISSPFSVLRLSSNDDDDEDDDLPSPSIALGISSDVANEEEENARLGKVLRPKKKKKAKTKINGESAVGALRSLNEAASSRVLPEWDDDDGTVHTCFTQIDEAEETSPKWETVPSSSKDKFRPRKTPAQETSAILNPYNALRISSDDNEDDEEEKDKVLEEYVLTEDRKAKKKQSKLKVENKKRDVKEATSTKWDAVSRSSSNIPTAEFPLLGICSADVNEEEASANAMEAVMKQKEKVKSKSNESLALNQASRTSPDWGSVPSRSKRELLPRELPEAIPAVEIIVPRKRQLGNTAENKIMTSLRRKLGIDFFNSRNHWKMLLMLLIHSSAENLARWAAGCADQKQMYEYVYQTLVEYEAELKHFRERQKKLALQIEKPLLLLYEVPKKVGHVTYELPDRRENILNPFYFNTRLIVSGSETLF